MSKITKILALVALLGLQMPIALADLETGTGAQAEDSAMPGFNIIQNEDGTFTADRPDVNVEFVPAEDTDSADATDNVQIEDVPGLITDAQNAVGTTIETESPFSLRRIAKWGTVLTGLLLIIVVLMQEKGVGLSSTFGGSGGFYASKRGVEKVLFRFTIILAVLFSALNLLAMSL